MIVHGHVLYFKLQRVEMKVSGWEEADVNPLNIPRLTFPFKPCRTRNGVAPLADRLDTPHTPSTHTPRDYSRIQRQLGCLVVKTKSIYHHDTPTILSTEHQPPPGDG